MPEPKYFPAYPPMVRGTAQAPQRDFCSRKGAVKLAEMIRAAWAKCGRDVRPTIRLVPVKVREDALYAVDLPPEVASGIWRP